MRRDGGDGRKMVESVDLEPRRCRLKHSPGQVVSLKTAMRHHRNENSENWYRLGLSLLLESQLAGNFVSHRVALVDLSPGSDRKALDVLVGSLEAGLLADVSDNGRLALLAKVVVAFAGWFCAIGSGARGGIGPKSGGAARRGEGWSGGTWGRSPLRRAC